MFGGDEAARRKALRRCACFAHLVDRELELAHVRLLVDLDEPELLVVRHGAGRSARDRREIGARSGELKKWREERRPAYLFRLDARRATNSKGSRRSLSMCTRSGSPPGALTAVQPYAEVISPPYCITCARKQPEAARRSQKRSREGGAISGGRCDLGREVAAASHLGESEDGNRELNVLQRAVGLVAARGTLDELERKLGAVVLPEALRSEADARHVRAAHQPGVEHERAAAARPEGDGLLHVGHADAQGLIEALPTGRHVLGQLRREGLVALEGGDVKPAVRECRVNQPSVRPHTRWLDGCASCMRCRVPAVANAR